jgi:hypothetical protein
VYELLKLLKIAVSPQKTDLPPGFCIHFLTYPAPDRKNLAFQHIFLLHIPAASYNTHASVPARSGPTEQQPEQNTVFEDFVPKD